MAKNNETTTKFLVDISELKKSMQEAKRQVAIANSEFKAVSSSMDDWAKSSDGLKAKLKQLDSNLNSQKSILASLERQYELTVKEMGEGSKAADDLKIKINNQKAVVNKTEREISEYKETLEEVSKAEKTAAKTGKDVAEVLEDMGKEAEKTGEGFTVLKGAVATFAGNAISALVGGIKNGISAMIGLSAETREYREDLAKLETAYKTAGLSTEDATKVYKDFYAVLGESDRSVEAVNHLAKFADSQEDLTKWTTIATGVWGTFGDSLPIEGLTEAANETMKTGKLTGVLVDALTWAGIGEEEFQESLDNCISEQERQALITHTLNNLYSEAADNYRETNKSVMDANKVNSDYTDTLAEMGAKLEPVTTAAKKGFTELLQELLKLVDGVDMEAFTAKIEEGFAVLKDEVLPAVKEGFGWILANKDDLISGLGGIAVGFAAFNIARGVIAATNAIKGMTAATWALNAAQKANLIGVIIAAVTALVAAFIYLWNNCEWFRNFWIGLWENIKTSCSIAIDAIVNFFTVTIPQAIANMVAFFAEIPVKISEWLTNALTNVKQWADNMVTKAKELGKNFLNSVTTFFSNLPYNIGYVLGLVIGHIIKWGVDLYTFATTKVPAFINKVVEFFTTLPSKVQTWLLNTIAKVAVWAVNMGNKARETGTNFINNVVNIIKNLPSKVSEWLSQVISKVSAWASDLAQKGKEAAQNLINTITDTIKSLPDKFVSIGSNIVNGLWSGFKNSLGTLKANIKSSLSGLVDGAKSALGIHSPSKVFADEIGKWIPEGIAVGIKKNAKSALDSMRNLTANAVGSARDSLNGSGVTSSAGGVVNNFYQNNYSPKSLSRLEIYRQSKNLLGYAGGV